jgi:hypothetical protein
LAYDLENMDGWCGEHACEGESGGHGYGHGYGTSSRRVELGLGRWWALNVEEPKPGGVEVIIWGDALGWSNTESKRVGEDGPGPGDDARMDSRDWGSPEGESRRRVFIG